MCRVPLLSSLARKEREEVVWPELFGSIGYLPWILYGMTGRRRNMFIASRNRLILLTVCAALTFLLMAATQSGQARAAQKPLTIGFVVKTLTNPFYIKMKVGAEKAAKQYNVKLLFQASRTELDTEEFIRIVEDMTQKKVDGLITVPGAPKETTPVIMRTIKA